ADGCKLTHRVIVSVVAGRRAVIAEQGRNLSSSVRGVGQKADLLFIRLVDHHIAGRNVAVMATEAEQDAADFLRAGGDGRGQSFRVGAIVAECDYLAVQWAGVLSPQCVAASVGGAGVAGTERA